MESLVFLGFSGLMLLAALLVVMLKNPVHAMLALIVTLFNAAGVVLTTGAEYVAFIMVIVYGGAVAVLFLFVVMMLDVKSGDVSRKTWRDLPALGAVVGLLAGDMALIASGGVFAKPAALPEGSSGVGNVAALGKVLFTDYAFAFEISGVILLVATIGAILLTHRVRSGVRRQKASDQIARKPADVLELCDVQSEEGVWDEGGTVR